MRLEPLLAALLLTLTAGASAQDVVIVIETYDQLSAPPPTQLQTPVIEVPEAPAPSLQAPLQYAQQHPQPVQQVAAHPLTSQLDVRRRRPRIGGPISMMAAGVVAGIASAFTAVLANDLDDWGCSSDCGPSGEFIGLSVMSAAAFTIALAGVIMLIRRVASRRRMSRENRASPVGYEQVFR